MNVIIQKSKKPDKKLDAIIDGKKIVSFGSAGMSDYIHHKNVQRKERYITRHEKNEDWTKSGIKSAGFYSRWVLWNKKTLKESVDDLNKKYKNITFKSK